jgi:hypothetical protein
MAVDPSLVLLSRSTSASQILPLLAESPFDSVLQHPGIHVHRHTGPYGCASTSNPSWLAIIELLQV